MQSSSLDVVKAWMRVCVAEMGNVLEMKEGGPGDVVDVVVQLQLAVTIYSKVADVWGGRQSIVDVGLMRRICNFSLLILT